MDKWSPWWYIPNTLSLVLTFTFLLSVFRSTNTLFPLGFNSLKLSITNKFRIINNTKIFHFLWEFYFFFLFALHQDERIILVSQSFMLFLYNFVNSPCTTRQHNRRTNLRFVIQKSYSVYQHHLKWSTHTVVGRWYLPITQPFNFIRRSWIWVFMIRNCPMKCQGYNPHKWIIYYCEQCPNLLTIC